MLLSDLFVLVTWFVPLQWGYYWLHGLIHEELFHWIIHSAYLCYYPVWEKWVRNYGLQAPPLFPRRSHLPMIAHCCLFSFCVMIQRLIQTRSWTMIWMAITIIKNQPSWLSMAIDQIPSTPLHRKRRSSGRPHSHRGKFSELHVECFWEYITLCDSVEFCGCILQEWVHCFLPDQWSCLLWMTPTSCFCPTDHHRQCCITALTSKQSLHSDRYQMSKVRDLSAGWWKQCFPSFPWIWSWGIRRNLSCFSVRCSVFFFPLLLHLL